MAQTRITKGVIKPNENYDTHNIASTGIVTATGLDINGNGDISGNLSVGGVITYEDVTSIDSVGIITARTGSVSPYADIDDFVSVGNNIHLGNAGVITATSFVGSGAALTGIDATAIKDSGGNVKIQAQASGAIHTGVSTFQDIDVDGHTELDNVNIAGVVTANQIKLEDNKFLLIGTGNDLQLRHDGNHSYIQDTGTGNLYLTSNNFNFFSPTNEKFAVFNNHSSVDLYHDDVKRLETTSTGIKVTGTTATGSVFLGDFRVKNTDDSNFVTFKPAENLVRWHDNDKATFGNLNDLQIYHDGTNSRISNTTGYLSIQTDNFSIFNAAANENIIVANADDGVDIFFNGNKKFETTNVGAVVSGILTATSFSGDGSGLSGIVAVPSGCILLWSGAANAIPSGFVLCNGSNSTPDLRGKFVVGYHDSNGDYDVGDTGGAETVTLSEAQIPSHNHSFSSSHTHGSGSYSTNTTGSHTHTWQRQDVGINNGYRPWPASNNDCKSTTVNTGSNGNHSHTITGTSGSGTASGTTGNAGSGNAHENRPPFYALCYIMKT